MAKPGAKRYQEIPLKMVGGTRFGRYDKISSEQTYNMIQSDGWSVNFAGYKNVVTINPTGVGRGIYSSNKLGKMFAVIDDDVFVFDKNLNYIKANGNLSTSIGDVFIEENNNAEVVFSDNQYLYVYTNSTNALTKLTSSNGVDFTPGYLTFQNGRIISPDTRTNKWRLSALNNAMSFPTGGQFEGAVQTKPVNAVACVRFPARGNLLLVFGQSVAEQWYDVGAQLFPYQRSQSTNVDYGCLNPATIAQGENIVVWLAINEKSGPVILYTNGGDIKHISTDGIDYQLSRLKNPQNSYGFMVKQDGHLFYCITFVDDNLSYIYDFNNDSFSTLSDENLNYFPAKRVAFFNDEYYFVSINDGNLYNLGTQYDTYDYGNGRVKEIPRIRIPPSIFLPDQSRFINGYAGFTIEQGQYSFDYRDTRFYLTTEDNNPITTENGLYIGGGYNFRNRVPRVDMATSADGGNSYGSYLGQELNPLGNRKNRFMWYQLGSYNYLTYQFRFYMFGRSVFTDGVAGIYQ